MDRYNLDNVFSSPNSPYVQTNSQINQNGNSFSINPTKQFMNDISSNQTPTSIPQCSTINYMANVAQNSRTEQLQANLRKPKSKGKDFKTLLSSYAAETQQKLSREHFINTASDNTLDNSYNLRSRAKPKSSNYVLRSQTTNPNTSMHSGNFDNQQQVPLNFNYVQPVSTSESYIQNQRCVKHSTYSTVEELLAQSALIPKKRTDTSQSSESPLDLRRSSNESSTQGNMSPFQTNMNRSLAQLNLTGDNQKSCFNIQGSTNVINLDSVEDQGSHTPEEISIGQSLLNLKRSAQPVENVKTPTTFSQPQPYSQYYPNTNNSGYYASDLNRQNIINRPHTLVSTGTPNPYSYQQSLFNYGTNLPSDTGIYNSNGNDTGGYKVTGTNNRSYSSVRPHSNLNSIPMPRTEPYRGTSNVNVFPGVGSVRHHTAAPPYSAPYGSYLYGQTPYNSYPVQNCAYPISSNSINQQFNYLLMNQQPASSVNQNCSTTSMPLGMPASLGSTRGRPSTRRLSSNLQTPSSQLAEAATGKGARSRGASGRRTAAQISPTNADSKPQKRSRTTYNSLQLKILEEEFSKQQYCNQELKNRLAKTLNMTPNQVKVWFQNRRTRERKNDPSFPRSNRRGRRQAAEQEGATNYNKSVELDKRMHSRDVHSSFGYTNGGSLKINPTFQQYMPPFSSLPHDLNLGISVANAFSPKQKVKGSFNPNLSDLNENQGNGALQKISMIPYFHSNLSDSENQGNATSPKVSMPTFYSSNQSDLTENQGNNDNNSPEIEILGEEFTNRNQNPQKNPMSREMNYVTPPEDILTNPIIKSPEQNDPKKVDKEKETTGLESLKQNSLKSIEQMFKEFHPHHSSESDEGKVDNESSSNATSGQTIYFSDLFNYNEFQELNKDQTKELPASNELPEQKVNITEPSQLETPSPNKINGLETVQTTPNQNLTNYQDSKPLSLNSQIPFGFNGNDYRTQDNGSLLSNFETDFGLLNGRETPENSERNNVPDRILSYFREGERMSVLDEFNSKKAVRSSNENNETKMTGFSYDNPSCSWGDVTIKKEVEENSGRNENRPSSVNGYLYNPLTSGLSPSNLLPPGASSYESLTPPSVTNTFASPGSIEPSSLSAGYSGASGSNSISLLNSLMPQFSPTDKYESFAQSSNRVFAGCSSELYTLSTVKASDASMPKTSSKNFLAL